MSHFEEEPGGLDANENMSAEENGGTERTSLMVDKEPGDGEIYNASTFFKARSFRIGLVFSLLLIILIVIVIIVVPVAIVVTNRSRSSELGQRLTLENVFDSKFQSRYYGGQWTNGQLLVMSDENGVTLYNPRDNETTVLINSTRMAELTEMYGTISQVKPSPSSSQLLLVVNQTKVYRHSYVADYLLYDNGEEMEVTKPDNVEEEERIQYAEWNPTRQMIVYVIDYNVYLWNTTQPDSSPIAITSNGTKNGVRYGIPDWVYEEEVISDNHAVWWSGDGAALLYASFNDTFVEDYSFPMYGPFEDVYTTIIEIPYPKAGATNPTVGLYVVNVSTPEVSKSLDPPADIADMEHYFTYTGWMSNSTPFAVWVRRTQNHSEYCAYPFMESDCSLLYTVDTRGWIEVIEPPFSSLDGSALFTLTSADINDNSFTHIAQLEETGSVTFLTSGAWEVTTIVGRTQDHIMYVSTQTSPRQRHIYSLILSNGVIFCLTCSQEDWDLPKSENTAIGKSCDYFSASCDDLLDYCILTCSGPMLPFTLLVRFDKENDKFELVQNLESNDVQREAIADLQLPTVQNFVVPEDSEGPSLNGKMMLPPGFNSKNKYPVLVYVYGGPNSQLVDDRVQLQSLSRVFLSSNLSMIVASIDGRGTGFRGDNFKFTVYRNLGHFETIDQVRAGKYLQSLSYVDGSKLAIYGASYGGYMAGMVGSSQTGVYSVAISQSPVTDWHYYDSIYTERYMITPSENEQNYRDSSVLYRASYLSDVDYLLIHGTGDDNVHFQNTAQLVEALTEANVLFDMQIYTDKAHSLAGGNTQKHLYELIAKFLRLSFRL